ncbi:MAG: choloylglycine hydrolase [Lachnospira sp.]
MCTCIDFKTTDNYFGRNLDLEYRFNEKVVITPRGYEFKLKNGNVINTKSALIGMATVVNDYPLYAEASNESGLSMAGLYFPGNAKFFEPDASKLNLSPYELIPYLLGLYSTVSEVRGVFDNLNITNTAFMDNMPVTDLHWMISDGNDCIVVEQMQEGLKVYDNPLGVLTNNPPFDYHIINVNNYINLTPNCAKNRFSDKINLSQYGQGMGALGLPGDTSPASRFVRAAFNKLNSSCKGDEEESVSQFFHILDSVAMVKGATVTAEGKYDITSYSCCINVSKGIYYYKTYTNNQITAVRMTDKEKNKKELSVYDLVEEQQIRYEN